MHNAKHIESVSKLREYLFGSDQMLSRSCFTISFKSGMKYEEQIICHSSTRNNIKHSRRKSRWKYVINPHAADKIRKMKVG